MKISSDEARALAFIAALIGLTLLGRWVDRPRPLGEGEPEIDLAAQAAQAEAALEGRKSGTSPAARGTGAWAGSHRSAIPTSPTSPASPPSPPSPPSPLNVNAATAPDLERLPGIGPALAARIIAYRDSVGRFRTLEELDSVRGIGPAMLARLKPLLHL